MSGTADCPAGVTVTETCERAKPRNGKIISVLRSVFRSRFIYSIVPTTAEGIRRRATPCHGPEGAEKPSRLARGKKPCTLRPAFGDVGICQRSGSVRARASHSYTVSGRIRRARRARSRGRRRAYRAVAGATRGIVCRHRLQHRDGESGAGALSGVGVSPGRRARAGRLRPDERRFRPIFIERHRLRRSRRPNVYSPARRGGAAARRGVRVQQSQPGHDGGASVASAHARSGQSGSPRTSPASVCRFPTMSATRESRSGPTNTRC